MPSSDVRADIGEPLCRSVREVIVELSQTEDALREWRTRTGRREVAGPDVHALLSRQRELVDELRTLSGNDDLAEPDVRVEADEQASPVAS